mmetsp:Transcript_4261/g.8591  ORF Transcript_4261/g.8591 Transcript_4261/m.8591 type:complete len:206 (+) Transcript_4261:71-688(+)|eukprot:CAMPEP_0181315762 /NCGR_PEP_ID=MMETSP1101-20121128/15545_1 /TAXON_ID=46948 /ORGANISM="Rhodomonas abbreviata, Strain Caron Lab Isolate" /LENGTH=205 /DNA_ID=CAMNT_0023422985 /DNA_START=69 /DNA_END=686 /DNA_ORIENTATION=+
MMRRHLSMVSLCVLGVLSVGSARSLTAAAFALPVAAVSHKNANSAHQERTLPHQEVVGALGKTILPLAALSILFLSGDASAEQASSYHLPQDGMLLSFAKAPPTYIHRATGRFHRWDSGLGDNKRDWYNNHASLFGDEGAQTSRSALKVSASTAQAKKPQNNGYGGDKKLAVLARMFPIAMCFVIGSVLVSDNNYDPFDSPPPWD